MDAGVAARPVAVLWVIERVTSIVAAAQRVYSVNLRKLMVWLWISGMELGTALH